MKIQVLTHHIPTRERNQDNPTIQVNYNSDLHPFPKPRELTRAFNAVKLDRLFAKPFIGSLPGHTDGVYCMAKHPNILNILLSASANGEIRLWDISMGKSKWINPGAHHQFIRSVSFVPGDISGNKFISGSDDLSVKLWDITDSTQKDPVKIFNIGNPVSGVDHHPIEDVFATVAGGIVSLWSHHRSTFITQWKRPGLETLTHIKFNPADYTVLGTCGLDRTIGLVDTRMDAPLARVTLSMRSNSLCWNPMEPINFAAASEDSNCYLFDMRRLTSPLNVLEGHSSAVIDVDFSPTGEELVTGSYDRTLRIFSTKHGRSRDVYHTKRMQKIFSVRWSMDAQFIFSSSDDGSIRSWRASASSRSATLNIREKEALEYADSLKKKYAHIPEIKRIANHRHIPKPILNAQKEKRIILAAKKRKEENRRKHSTPNSLPQATLRGTVVENIKISDE